MCIHGSHKDMTEEVQVLVRIDREARALSMNATPRFSSTTHGKHEIEKCLYAQMLQSRFGEHDLQCEMLNITISYIICY